MHILIDTQDLMHKFRECRLPEGHSRGVSKSGHKALFKSLFINAALKINVFVLPKLYCKNILDELYFPSI